MAVVKANYVKRGTGEKGRAKASVRYIQHRKGKDEQTITRTLYGREGELTRQEAYRIIDEAPKGSFFYRFIISPDPRSEDRNHDLDMRDISEQTIKALEDLVGRNEPLEWIAATHSDHAPHLHTHVLAVVPKRLYQADLNYLRHHATKASLEQRRYLDLAHYRERERPYPLQRHFNPSRRFASFHTQYTGGRRGFSKSSAYQKPSSSIKPAFHTCTCSRCFASHVHHVRDPVHKCKSCGFILHRQQQLRIIKPTRAHKYKGAAWEL